MNEKETQTEDLLKRAELLKGKLEKLTEDQFFYVLGFIDAAVYYNNEEVK